jgi:hypothetical protein
MSKHHALRTLAVALLALGLLPAPAATQAGKDPKPAEDDPPVGKGKIYFLEDFETTAAGHVPRAFQKTGAVAVAEDQAHSGRHSLRIEAAMNGPRRITMKGDILKELGGQHWGRLYFKVQQPSPQPDNGVIHSTLVAGSAQSPQSKDPIEVRVLDTVMNKEGMYQYIYNVQPQKRAEFGKGSSYKYKFTDEWTLAEWYVDFATQTYRLFINGEEIKDVAFMKGAGQYDKSEIPEVFESLSFGWNNYQGAGKGFVAWIDDIALAKDRLGARGIPPMKTTKKP